MLKYALSTSRAVSALLVSSCSKLLEEASAVVEHSLSMIDKFLAHWLPRLLYEVKSSTTALRNDDDIIELTSIHCNIIVELQSSHQAFQKYIGPFLVFFYDSFNNVFGADSAAASVQIPQALERLTISFLACLANAASSENGAAICEGFFTPTRVQSLTRQALLLFSCHLYITDTTLTEEEDTDREYWLNNPEGFYQWELQRSSEDDVGCAAQNLALIETNRGKEVIVPWFVGHSQMYLPSNQ